MGSYGNALEKGWKVGCVKSHFFDSGSYSLKTAAKEWATKTGKSRWDYYETDEFWKYIDAYANFVKKYAAAIDYYANVDVIYNPELTYRNQKYLETEHNLTPIPVVHYENASVQPQYTWLKKYMDEEYDFIGVGGLAEEDSQEASMSWIDGVFDIVCDTPNRLPKVRIHLFGITTHKLLWRWPAWCMTPEHTILTKDGWKGKDEISVGDMVLGFKDGKSQWEQVLDVYKYSVEDEPIVKMDYRTFSARVTENHRWRVLGRDGKWVWKTTDGLNTKTWIPRIAEYQGPTEKKHPDWLVELFAWFWTEGHYRKWRVRKDGTRYPCKKPEIGISQSQSANPKKVARIRSVLDSCGAKYREDHVTHAQGITGKPSEGVCFYITGEVRDKILSISGGKTIPYRFLTELTVDQLKLFINVSVMADGSFKLPLSIGRERYSPWVVRPRRVERKTEIDFGLSQKDGKNIDQLRVACLLAGIPTSRSEGVSIGSLNPGYKYSHTQSSSVNFIFPGGDLCKKETIPYTGEVWCIRTKSGAFFTKCNEKIYVTGNSIDSTAWTKGAAYGRVTFPRLVNDKWDFKQEPFVVFVSEESPHRKDEWHYLDMGPEKKAVLELWLKEINIPLGVTAEDGTIIEEGVINHHTERRAANLLLLEAIRKAIPEYPRPWPRRPRKPQLLLG